MPRLGAGRRGFLAVCAGVAVTGIETAMIIAAVGSAAVGAYGAIEQGNQQAKAQKFNAQMQDRNAEIARRNAFTTEAAGEADAARQAEDGRRRIAAAANAAGGSGIDPNSGTVLDVLSDLAGQSKLDEELTRWRARQQAMGLRDQAEGFNLQAGADRVAGSAAQTAGYARAAGTLLSSAPSIYGAAKGAGSGVR